MSARERLIVGLAPTCVAVALYWGFLSRDKDADAFEAQAAAAGPVLDLESSARQVDQLRRKLAGLEARRDELVRRSTPAAPIAGPGLEHAVLRLLADHGLGVAAADPSAAAAVPDSLSRPQQRWDELLGKASPNGPRAPAPAVDEFDEFGMPVESTSSAAQSTGTDRPLRAYHLRGPYLATLEALEAVDELCVPVGLELDAAPGDEGAPRWTLVLAPRRPS